jgi:hypothetical protein
VPARIIVQTPAVYTAFELTEHALVERSTGVYDKRAPGAPQKSRDRQRVPLLSSPDGRYAVAVYTPQALHFLDYTTRSNERSLPASSCHKITLHFAHPAQPGQSYSYRSFLIVGDLETVKASLKKLPGSFEGRQKQAAESKLSHPL